MGECQTIKSNDGNKQTPRILVCTLTATTVCQINHVKLGGQGQVQVAGIMVSHSFQSVETCNRAGDSSLQLSKSLRHLQAPQDHRLLQDPEVLPPASSRSSSIVAGFFKIHRLAITRQQALQTGAVVRTFPSDPPFPVLLTVSVCPAQPILNRSDYFEVSWLCEPLSMS